MAEQIKYVNDGKARESAKTAGFKLPGKRLANQAYLPEIEHEALNAPLAFDNGEERLQNPDGSFKFTLGISVLDGPEKLG